MSLRHMQDLEKFRPAVAFMIQHQGVIFHDTEAVPVPLTLQMQAPQTCKAVGAEKSPTLVRPNLTVVIPTAQPVAVGHTVKVTPRSMGQGHGNEEWKVSCTQMHGRSVT
jgi:hypothetical protein